MIRIRDLRLPPGSAEAEMRTAAAGALGISPAELREMHIARLSVDARRGRETALVCTLLTSCADEARILRRCRDGRVSLYEKAAYVPPENRRTSALRPVVVGMGPAGLFAALTLAEAGAPCVVLERGGDIDSRTAAVERAWRTGVPDRHSNVQFGEGGAGTFSDGKLTTGTHDGRISAVLDTFHRFGAPEDILWSARPHIGTDILREVVRGMRTRLLELGCEVRFFHRMTGFRLDGVGLRALEVRGPAGPYVLETDAAALAIGHSARDSFAMLCDAGLEMVPKPFAMGVRIEHKQAAISAAQYGAHAGQLPPADYRLAAHLENGRHVFSFCVCPGGVVVASASEEGTIVTNGMSCRARDGENINGALLVNVTPADFDGADALAGVRFQAEWERRAYALGGANGFAPAQTCGDFLAGRASVRGGAVVPSYHPGVTWTDLAGALPDFVTESLRLAVPRLGRKVRGFDSPDAVLTGIESRSSSPVRICRGEDLCATKAPGLYPCGEGAGYAGGIVSAAVDGIRVAERILEK